MASNGSRSAEATAVSSGSTSLSALSARIEGANKEKIERLEELKLRLNSLSRGDQPEQAQAFLRVETAIEERLRQAKVNQFEIAPSSPANRTDADAKVSVVVQGSSNSATSPQSIRGSAGVVSSSNIRVKAGSPTGQVQQDDEKNTEATNGVATAPAASKPADQAGSSAQPQMDRASSVDAVRKRLRLSHAKSVDRAAEAMAEFGKLDADVEQLEAADHKEEGWWRWRHVLERPRLRQYWKNNGAVLVRENAEHKASWNELFFDLVFVATFAHLAHDLEHVQTVHAVCEFGVLFTALWRTWAQANLYVNRFAPSDAFHKIFFLAEMTFTLGIVIYTMDGVAVSYILARGITELATLWSRRFLDPKEHAHPRRTMALEHYIYLVSTIPWIVSLFVKKEGNGTHPDTIHLILWFIGLFIEITLQAVLRSRIEFNIPYNVEHMCERFCIFLVVMLGEQVLAAVSYSASVATWQTYVASISAGVLIFTFQIFYFDVEAGHQSQHALLKEGVPAALWYFIHLPLQASIVAGAGGSTLLVGETTSGEAHHGNVVFMRWLFCGATSTSWWCLATIGYLHTEMPTVIYPKKYRLAYRIVCGIITMFLPVAGKKIAPWGYLLICACLGLVGGCAELYGGVAIHHHAGHANHKKTKPGPVESGDEKSSASDSD